MNQQSSSAQEKHSTHMRFPCPCGGGRISPICPSQIGLGNPGEGCPAGRWPRPATKPAELGPARVPGIFDAEVGCTRLPLPASPRPRTLAGAARIDDATSNRPATYPSPGFAKLACGAPSETALSHTEVGCFRLRQYWLPNAGRPAFGGRGGALFWAADPEGAVPNKSNRMCKSNSSFRARARRLRGSSRAGFGVETRTAPPRPLPLKGGGWEGVNHANRRAQRCRLGRIKSVNAVVRFGE